MDTAVAQQGGSSGWLPKSSLGRTLSKQAGKRKFMKEAGRLGARLQSDLFVTGP